jgi:hypothetical protein
LIAASPMVSIRTSCALCMMVARMDLPFPVELKRADLRHHRPTMAA